MSRIFLLLAIGAAAIAADDAWTKVQELRSGAELRILKKGSSQPINATFDQADDQRIYIVTKKEQLAIAKEGIDRLDARPSGKTQPRMKTESKVKVTDPDVTPRPAPSAPVPGTSSSTSVTMGGGKPDFETVYRRTAAAPAK